MATQHRQLFHVSVVSPQTQTNKTTKNLSHTQQQQQQLTTTTTNNNNNTTTKQQQQQQTPPPPRANVRCTSIRVGGGGGAPLSSAAASMSTQLNTVAETMLMVAERPVDAIAIDCNFCLFGICCCCW
jgi:hypothetical protein